MLGLGCVFVYMVMSEEKSSPLVIYLTATLFKNRMYRFFGDWSVCIRRSVARCMLGAEMGVLSSLTRECSVRVAVRYIFFGGLDELPNLVWFLGPGTTQDLQAWQTATCCVALPVRENGL